MPIGLSANYFLPSKTHATAAVLAFGLNNEERFYLPSNYLWIFPAGVVFDTLILGFWEDVEWFCKGQASTMDG